MGKCLSILWLLQGLYFFYVAFDPSRRILANDFYEIMVINNEDYIIN